MSKTQKLLRAGMRKLLQSVPLRPATRRTTCHPWHKKSGPSCPVIDSFIPGGTSCRHISRAVNEFLIGGPRKSIWGQPGAAAAANGSAGVRSVGVGWGGAPGGRGWGWGLSAIHKVPQRAVRPNCHSYDGQSSQSGDLRWTPEPGNLHVNQATSTVPMEICP